MTVKLLLAFFIAFAAAAVIGKVYVPWLRNIHAGQQIREDGPRWHMSKAGTPTMGGVIFIVGVAVACLTVGWPFMKQGEFSHIFILVFALIFGFIGFIDDRAKLKHKANLGLTARAKFLLQLAAAVAFVYFMRRFGYVTANLYIPFANCTVPVWEPLYFLFAAFVIVGTVNAVNLTDGVDGLAAGTTLPVCLCYVAVGCAWGKSYLPVGVFASGLMGGLFGFLIYNYNPAKVFMGDTGSLFLGGAVCAMAFAYDAPLMLVLCGLVYLLETLSVIIQVTYFKLTHGKRVFKMSPFHHHLEMGGWTGHKWTEKQLFALFTTVSLLCCILAFLSVYKRYAI